MDPALSIEVNKLGRKLDQALAKYESVEDAQSTKEGRNKKRLSNMRLALLTFKNQWEI